MKNSEVFHLDGKAPLVIVRGSEALFASFTCVADVCLVTLVERDEAEAFNVEAVKRASKVSREKSL
jgi:hypothetical protein